LTSKRSPTRFDPMDPAREGKELRAGPEDAGRRLDKVLRACLPAVSLAGLYAALRKGRIRVNGRKAKPESRLEEGDLIFLDATLSHLNPRPEGPSPGRCDRLDTIADILILATEDLLFLNKPRGLVSQGDEGLEGRIRSALAGRSASSLSFSPGPLHRLDRNTTGVIAFPRSSAGARAFTALIRERALTKSYLALLDGEIASGGAGPIEWRDRIARDGAARLSAVSGDGEEARATMRPLVVAGGKSLVSISLHTGLTHQIRVQASSRGLPLSGDRKYGGSPMEGGYILHALSLGFPEPPFPDLPRLVSADLPAETRARLSRLFGESRLTSALADAFGENL
jgi:23S rRNA pseudouridine955/2504/2580 synthase